MTIKPPAEKRGGIDEAIKASRRKSTSAKETHHGAIIAASIGKGRSHEGAMARPERRNESNIKPHPAAHHIEYRGSGAALKF